jgi:hypothetical protein
MSVSSGNAITKEMLLSNVKEWLDYDVEINKLQNMIKELKNKKKSLSGVLMNVMKENEIDCFDINGGSIVYKKNKVKQPINSKTLLSILKNYNEEKAAEITEFVLSNREELFKEVIKRKQHK